MPGAGHNRLICRFRSGAGNVSRIVAFVEAAVATSTGAAGDDTLKGTTGADIFNLDQGGNDTVGGRGGDDVFNFGATFTSGDSVSGDLGTDTINLDGDYSAGIVFHTATLSGVEKIVLAAGSSYAFTTVDANIAAGQYIIIDGSALGAGETLHVDGHRELDGHLHLTGGAGDDILSGGANAHAYRRPRHRHSGRRRHQRYVCAERVRTGRRRLRRTGQRLAHR
jgi:Ca2+-binding RTX toxin-like protein